MNADTVFSKTRAGLQEIENRALRLDIRHRSLLIMLDGKRSVADVQSTMGLGEALVSMLEHLLRLGLIDGNQGAGTSTQATAPPAPSTVPGDWQARRQAAVHAVNDFLGPMGDALAMSLEDLNTPEDLPQLLELACSTIKDVRGKQTAERFRQVVGLAGS